jgi:hypothetical protein
MIDLQKLPCLPQRQDSTSDQLTDLIAVANRLGMYDAADAVTQLAKSLPSPKYGCHCDLEEGVEPDECVIGTGREKDCIYAKPGMRKEQCKCWLIIKPRKRG